MGKGNKAKAKALARAKAARETEVTVQKQQPCSMTDAVGEAKLASILSKIAQAQTLSKKQRRKLEIARQKEAEAASLALAESKLPEAERTTRQHRREYMDQWRLAKSQVAQLKKRLAKLGKKNVNEREARKVIGKQIKTILLNARRLEMPHSPVEASEVPAEDAVPAAPEVLEVIDME